MNAPTNGLTLRRTPLIALLALSAAAMLLGGCNDQKKKDALTIAQLQEDNQQLMSENEKLSGEAKAAADRASAAESEAATLKAAPQNPSAGGGMTSDKVLSVAGDVAFGPGSVVLTSAGKKEVDKIISIIKNQYSGHRIEIAGFTDPDPLKKTKKTLIDNENMSAQRALAVERYMNSKGISEDITHSSGYGSSNQKGSKKESRRVEIRILAN